MLLLERTPMPSDHDCKFRRPRTQVLLSRFRLFHPVLSRQPNTSGYVSNMRRNVCVAQKGQPRLRLAILSALPKPKKRQSNASDCKRKLCLQREMRRWPLNATE